MVQKTILDYYESNIQVIAVNEIVIGNRIRLNTKKSNSQIENLANSIKEIGLLNPITITKDKRLVAGFHRLQAFKKLGKSAIPCVITTLNDPLLLQLQEIDENLIRYELHYLDIGLHLEKRQEIYEKIHGNSENIRIEKIKKNLQQYTDAEPSSISEPTKSFAQDTSEKTGIHEKTIRENIQIAKNIDPSLYDDVKEYLPKKDALELSRVKKDKKPDTERQKKILEKIKNNEASNVKVAKKIIEKEQIIVKLKKNDPIDAWSEYLQDKDDREKFQQFGMNQYQDDEPKVFNIWNFHKRDPRLGIDFPGNIPGQIMLNLLYYYTEQGDLVLDPMSGGGSTVDACKIMSRKCIAYDIAPQREDIKKRDIILEGIDSEIKDIQLLFLDPPYWRQKKGEYSKHETNLSNMSFEKFNESMREIINACNRVLRPGGYLALIMGPTQFSMHIYDHAFVFYQDLENILTFENRIIVPYNTQQVTGQQISRAREKKYMLKLYRDLLIFRKE